MVIPQRRSLGGFDVGRVLPFAKRRMVGLFVFDQTGRHDEFIPLPALPSAPPNPIS